MNTNEARILTIGLMIEHGLTDWSFAWSRAKQTYGSCFHRRKLIELSWPLTEVNSEADVRDTILHEIAHALVGPGNGHNWTWEQKAKQIGAKPQRCGNYKGGAAKISKWIGSCPSCPEMFVRERTPNPVRSWSHTVCQRMGKQATITWKRNEGVK